MRMFNLRWMQLSVGVICAFLLFPPLVAIPEASDRTVDCSAGGSIGAVLRRLSSGDVLKVSGTCNENITITRENVTLDGQGSATINGPDPSRATVRIVARRVDIIGFTITGGNDGIGVSSGENVLIDGNTIQNTGDGGIALSEGSSARIVNNVIQNNNNDGIAISEGSHARVGILTGGDTVASPNVIQNNAGEGISVERGASARIIGNTIKNNTASGVAVSDNSTADIASNAIDNNGTHGINMNRGAQVRLGRDSGTSIFAAPNSTTVNNSSRGIRCRAGGSVDGRLGSLNGSGGANDVLNDGTCIDSLTP